MRCIARGLIVALLTVVLCLYVALTSPNVVGMDYETGEDEAARLLEGSDVPSTTNRPQTSISAIIVVITCLIIISVLIAGIIVVAMTMDPSTGDDLMSEDEEMPLEPRKPKTFFGIKGYDDMFDEEEVSEL